MYARNQSMTHHLARALVEFRQQRNWTQSELALAVKASCSQISRWEAGKVMPHQPALRRIADTLGVTVEDLTSKPDSEPQMEVTIGEVEQGLNSLTAAKARNLAMNLVYLRSQRNLTVRDLGIAAGVSATQISRYERCLSTPRSTLLSRLAAALGVAVDQLTADTIDWKPQSAVNTRVGLLELAAEYEQWLQDNGWDDSPTVFSEEFGFKGQDLHQVYAVVKCILQVVHMAPSLDLARTEEIAPSPMKPVVTSS